MLLHAALRSWQRAFVSERREIIKFRQMTNQFTNQLV
jgi:hypothetical protein